MGGDLSSLDLKIQYDSGEDDVLWDFYIPVLSQANQYDRIAGFFSSSVFALAARGMAQFLSNHGKMRLVTCPKLSSNDVRMLEQSAKDMDSILAEQFITDYSQIEDQFKKDHVKALGWMLANGLLEMRIAVLTDQGRICTAEEIDRSGIMHIKVGILYDSCGYKLSFSGSNNESYSGWTDNNIEEFKVFSSWDGADRYLQGDIDKFESFWNGTRKDVRIKEIPDAVKEKLIEESRDFEPSKITPHAGRVYYSTKRILPEKPPLKPFYYQKNALKEWNENGRSLLLQMATGTGKTITAVCCLVDALKDTEKLVAVIACPQAVLAAQWKSTIEHLDIPVEYSLDIHSTRNWKTVLEREVRSVSIGRHSHLVIYVTHDIACSDSFTSVLKQYSGRVSCMLIGDEVHGMGAPETKKSLLEEYRYRIGLSATPQRWFDDAGSALIENYFGNRSFVFSIKEAQVERRPDTNQTFLVDFIYKPRFVSLDEDEAAKYKKITERIVRMGNTRQGNGDFTTEDIVQMLRFQRADIVKNANEKYGDLEKILDKLGPQVKNTIVFVSAEQIDNVMHIMGRRGIRASRFTQAQGTMPSANYGGLSEREFIIKQFKEGRLQILVAIKCLDEGIDIPSADTAVVMASSTNPREYIQRLGRIIRQAPGKGDATIYDMIVRPELSWIKEPPLLEMEKRIFKKEMDRVLDMSECAKNNADVLSDMLRIKQEVLSAV